MYLLTEVDCIKHTAGASQCGLIGQMMDGQVPLPPIPLGNSSIYLPIYLFLHQNTPDLFKVQQQQLLSVVVGVDVLCGAHLRFRNAPAERSLLPVLLDFHQLQFKYCDL